eukprot:TRINITY_DN21804_c0_g1_i2.p1 TRINITY_DN21804_c0_g1~~TRINITY_DN21804_c0_g1_i2.p1  ORF type:complete len:147 (-),score=3.81 TRINITY_DN21804_c0_g1_i2:458-898(-)
MHACGYDVRQAHGGHLERSARGPLRQALGGPRRAALGDAVGWGAALAAARPLSMRLRETSSPRIRTADAHVPQQRSTPCPELDGAQLRAQCPWDSEPGAADWGDGTRVAATVLRRRRRVLLRWVAAVRHGTPRWQPRLAWRGRAAR